MKLSSLLDYPHIAPIPLKLCASCITLLDTINSAPSANFADLYQATSHSIIFDLSKNLAQYQLILVQRHHKFSVRLIDIQPRYRARKSDAFRGIILKLCPVGKIVHD